MTVHELCFAPVTEIAHLVSQRKVSAREITEAFLARIDALDRKLNCFVQITAETALHQARQIDEMLGRGHSPGLLAGVPLGIKDIVDVEGVPTSHGAHRLFQTVPTTDAPVVRQLRAQGAVILGKTNLHEFAYGATTVNPHFGPTRNPWDVSRIPGGSSGGSAAAVAAGLCAAAVGTDTGGSIRIPASLCGIVGLKPTYDRVPRSGVTPLAWTLDHVGPMTRTVRDAALLLRVMSSPEETAPHHEAQPTSPSTSAPGSRLAGLRVGLPRAFFWEDLQDDVRPVVEEAVHKLEQLGADIVDVELPHAALAGDAVAVIISVEATAVHEHRLRTHPEAYGSDVRLRLESGFFLTGTDYVQAQRARTLLRQTFLGALERTDVLALPTTAVAAPALDEQWLQGPRGHVSARAALTRLTNPFNLTGLPALSVPCGFTPQRLPVGLQLVGNPYHEATLLRIGHAYEQVSGWTQLHPPLTITAP